MAGGRQTLHSERFCGRSNGRIKPIVPDAASVMSGGFAQIAEFAKSGPSEAVGGIDGPIRSLTWCHDAAVQLPHSCRSYTPQHFSGLIDMKRTMQ